MVNIENSLKFSKKNYQKVQKLHVLIIKQEAETSSAKQSY
jgi:hypothetical protein